MAEKKHLRKRPVWHAPIFISASVALVIIFVVIFRIRKQSSKQALVPEQGGTYPQQLLRDTVDSKSIIPPPQLPDLRSTDPTYQPESHEKLKKIYDVPESAIRAPFAANITVIVTARNNYTAPDVFLQIFMNQTLEIRFPSCPACGFEWILVDREYEILLVIFAALRLALRFTRRMTDRGRAGPFF